MKNKNKTILVLLIVVPQCWFITIVALIMIREAGSPPLGVVIWHLLPYIGIAGWAIIIGIVYSIKKRDRRYFYLSCSYLFAPTLMMSIDAILLLDKL